MRLNQSVRWAEGDLAQLSLPGSLQSSTRIHFSHYRRARAYTSVREENGRECLTFFRAQSGKWYVIQICQGEGKKWGERESKGRVLTAMMETEEAILLEDLVHFCHLGMQIHPGYLLWSNNMSISVQRIIMNGILLLKCQPPDSTGCAGCMQKAFNIQ